MCHGRRLALLAVLALTGQAAADPNDAEKHWSGQEPPQDGTTDAVADLLALPEAPLGVGGRGHGLKIDLGFAHIARALAQHDAVRRCENPIESGLLLLAVVLPAAGRWARSVVALVVNAVREGLGFGAERGAVLRAEC